MSTYFSSRVFQLTLQSYFQSRCVAVSNSVAREFSCHPHSSRCEGNSKHLPSRLAPCIPTLPPVLCHAAAASAAAALANALLILARLDPGGTRRCQTRQRQLYQ
ncbi:hypothetical protein E2C01_062050 [Portunus trituberculatus]|uniref:Uncharacterized protein n=1 Tax=Portunus trituberculatus TaxID=210409 RepID=A0A5B7HGZ1_PORTR|nr:hypothetical protein [Portunus trituberculatus]